ncbi:hypothetical protein CEXT_765841 [Caerostris extrusa]|uniref:Uncharacterized protein n=1 Tax=Caerostris extrusa TaxID=172846 RepID=A0AAV4XDF9_CAEEX|nr:hypothetical protein CEXT_765841 [Caerostris extrusa]
MEHFFSFCSSTLSHIPGAPGGTPPSPFISISKSVAKRNRQQTSHLDQKIHSSFYFVSEKNDVDYHAREATIIGFCPSPFFPVSPVFPKNPEKSYQA